MRYQLLAGDVRIQLAALAPASVQCCVTSPPYWGLRDYGCGEQIGLEASPDVYVAALVDVFADVWRVLKADGVCWVNLGDSYAGSSQRGGTDPSGLLGYGNSGTRDVTRTWAPARGLGELKPKDLVGIPWRVAFALQAAGWYLRSDVIWAKPNPMPESVTDRPTKAHEYLFLLTKAERYYYDAVAISEAVSPATIDRAKYHWCTANTKASEYQTMNGLNRDEPYPLSAMRNKRSVWTIPTEAYPEAHFATFPEALVEPCILAGSRPGDLVLDPFCGSGTVGAVAMRAQRDFVGIDLNPAYLALARRRIDAVAPLFAAEITA